MRAMKTKWLSSPRNTSVVQVMDGAASWPRFSTAVLIAASLTGMASAALMPPQYQDAVVALGENQLQFLPNGQCVIQWFTEGTGFLYGFLVEDNPDPTKRRYEVYLVTNRHVIEEHVASQAAAKLQHAQPTPSCPIPSPVDETSISARLNPLNSTSEGRQFPLSIKEWFFDSNGAIDVAAIRLNSGFLKEQGLQNIFFNNDNMAANKHKLKSLGVSAGDGVFVLGFPMNLAGVQRNYVIVRQGCIAHISDMLDGTSPMFLLDAFIFPGNSGGPVVLKPEVVSVSGTTAQNQAYLIGFVQSYQPYIDLAISPQTRRPRVQFEENSGLAQVLPTDVIDEAIIAWRSALPNP